MRRSHSDIQPIDISDLKMFQHYYTELYEELMYFLSSYIEDAALREDLIQDVWMKLWENRTPLPRGIGTQDLCLPRGAQRRHQPFAQKRPYIDNSGKRRPSV